MATSASSEQETNDELRLISSSDDNDERFFDRIFEHLTTVAHVCILGFSVYVICITFNGKFETFSLHPLLLTFGWMLIMNEAVFMINKDNILSRRMSLKWRIRSHWIMQTVALCCSISGVIVMFVLKEQYQDEHFKSAHAISGLLAVISASVPTLLTGIAALFHLELRRWISPKANKVLHGVSGVLTLIFGGVAMVLSLYFNWFKMKSGGSAHIFIFSYISICFGVFWVLLKPIFSLQSRLKSLLTTYFY